ncbi:hypothetical protein BD779DRAFT_1496046 [Infundibulicybe gibba]|nr:hypothetical protein BD779DRAFT_1496046 [Infundibulicybe gibba]
MTTTASSHTTTSWDSSNSGYVPPPRFQQLLVNSQRDQPQDSSAAQTQAQFQPDTGPNHSGVYMAPGSEPAPPQRPPVSSNQSHARSSSFFSFRNRHTSESSASSQPRNPSILQKQNPERTTHLPQTMNRSIPQGPSPQYSPPPPQQHQPDSQHAPQNQPPGPPSPQIQQHQQQQPSQLTRTPSSKPPAPAPPLHPEIRSVVSLTTAHAHKIYFSGPLVRRIERQPDGQKPAKDEGWTEVWAQLGGTTLSIWDMKQIQEASKQGKEVPPTYVNMTDAFIQVLGSVTVPATQTTPSQRYTNVLTLNTAGSNLLLFSCPSTASLISWAAALRLSAWEKSRLEEIYTAHVIRITLPKRDISTNLVQGRLEGWVRVRIAGQTDWKRMWMAVSAGAENPLLGERPGSQNSGRVGSTPTPPVPKKKRMSNLFSRDQAPAGSAAPQKPVISFYPTQKIKDRRRPLLTVTSVSQVFAVYPERPELISRSTLIKVEGILGDEDLAATMRTREGWVLIMPEVEGGLGQASEMLKWIVAFHDAFELYGRPEAWSWDPRDPGSLMFAYPVGPHKDLLFLDRELAETLDPRDDRTSAIRSRLRDILLDRMRGGEPGPTPASRASSEVAPSLPPIGEDGALVTRGPQLPPLNFSSTPSKAPMSPITERSSVQTHGAPSILGTYPVGESPISPAQQAQDQNQNLNQNYLHQNQLNTQIRIMMGPLSHSPLPTSPNTSQSPVDHQIRASSPPPATASHPVAKSSLDSGPQPDEGKPNHVSPVHPAVGGQSVGDTTTKNTMTSPITSTSPSMAAFSSPSEWSSGANPTLSENRPPPLSPQLHNPPGAPTAIKSMLSDRTSVLTSPHSIDQGSRVSVDRTSHLTSPHSIKGDDDLPIGHSPLMSPHSPGGHSNDLPIKAVLNDGPHFFSSPYSPVNPSRRLSGHTYSSGPSSPSQTLPSPNASHFPIQRAPESPAAMFNEAGALHHLQQQQRQPSESVHVGDHIKRKPTTILEKDNESGSSSESLPASKTDPTGTIESARNEASTSARANSNNLRAMPARQSTPMAFQRLPSPEKPPPATSPSGPGSHGRPGHTPAGRLSPTPRPGLGRKPSGARAPASNRPYNGDSFSSSQQVTETEEDSQSEQSMSNNKKSVGNGPVNPPRPSASSDEPDLDALAALSYLDVDDDEKTASPPMTKVAPLNVRTSDRRDTSSPQPVSAVSTSSSQPFKSSFAPSKQALERMAKAQAQQEAHHAAVHKPGRANGKKKPKVVDKGAWGESSDEEEEEEEEEEDVDSDDPPQTNRQPTPSSGLNSSNASTRPSLQQHPNHAPPPQLDAQIAQDRLRQQPRTLPQIPGGRFQPEHDEYPQQQPPRRMADQYPEAARRTQYDDGPQIRSQADFPTPGAARQSMWSQVLDPGRTTGAVPTNTRDTFVQLEPAETMTMAFTPQGLLSAGLQDKQDRSAKRQEELARETGASLINVPNKPPPPQTGLLGAITAHERERKREGGVGAALTEREREKRLAEERQRRFDDHQRQQLDQMQQGGSMYGAQFGYNPMMANPMMMGMNPMMMNPMMGGGMAPMMTGGGGLSPMMTGGGMTGGGMAPMMTGQMGYPGMMPAAQAYQQAMMAFSVAGSQAGGEGGAEGGANPQMLPNMTGNMQGFDPRMSMMSMMGGAQMGVPQMNPMGMQMTGMSGFDARFPPGV